MASSVKLADVVPSRFAHLTPPSEENIERIRADLEGGSKMLLNNPHVFKNEAGKYELLAGHDRTEAARRAGWDAIPVRDFSGALNTDDAILAHFCRENLLRKEVSKAAIAGEWLRKHPDWSDGRIADESGCSQQYVNIVRGGMVASGQLTSTSDVVREGRDGKKYKPRTVRTNVPTKRGIPHPTKVKYESADDMAAALIHRTTTPPNDSGVDKAPEGSPGSDDGDSTDEKGPNDGGRVLTHPEGESEVGAPTGAVTPAIEGGGRLLSRDEQLAAVRELQAREANPHARHPRRPPIPRLMEFVRVAVDLEEPSADELDAIPTNDLMLEHLERAHRIIGLILTRNGRSVAA